MFLHAGSTRVAVILVRKSFKCIISGHRFGYPMRPDYCGVVSEPRTQRSGVSGCVGRPLTPLRCVRGSDLLHLLPAAHPEMNWTKRSRRCISPARPIPSIARSAHDFDSLGLSGFLGDAAPSSDARGGFRSSREGSIPKE